ncbi:MAG: glucose-1-phosphate cytidylyltransferase [Chlamydiae bacterium]|nr:glucose-1-phosphate cytidylyltransferase [Chlamydiota bacterium]MBI3276216.1 glucose-1-phosphate cytidylyltransferase [Chlamydiota bacterium]
MNVAILCGGMGTRLREETAIRPKPMVTVGAHPILWHIMKTYSHFGFDDFVLALGYKGEMIKQYFINYRSIDADFKICLGDGKIQPLRPCALDWKVTLVDTGVASLTGGRLHRLEPYLKDETFFMTYGDGVSNIDIRKLLAFHRSHGKLATVAVVHPVARFGEIQLKGSEVVSFKEKPQTSLGWINGGFFVFEPEVFKYLHGDQTILEQDPLENLVRDGQLMAYGHEGFWYCLDTLRDLEVLEKLWESGTAPWKIWET